MKRKDMISLILTDAAHGEPHPLMGFIDWLIIDHEVPLSYVLDAAEKHFKIPRDVALRTLENLV